MAWRNGKRHVRESANSYEMEGSLRSDAMLKKRYGRTFNLVCISQLSLVTVMVN